MTYIETLHESLRNRGVEIHSRGLLTFTVDTRQVMLQPIDGSLLTEPVPQQRAAQSLVALADYARAANAVMTDTRLSQTGKDQDLRKLTSAIATRLQSDLDEAGAAHERAHAESKKDLLPVPVPAADAAQAIVDGELRGLLRQMDGGEAMRSMERQYAFLVAVMRQPLGIDAGVVDYAQRLWSERNPNAKTSTAAMRLSASWDEARKIVGACIAAVAQLSNGRVPALAA